MYFCGLFQCFSTGKRSFQTVGPPSDTLINYRRMKTMKRCLPLLSAFLLALQISWAQTIRHVVVSGETLYSLCKVYGITQEQLQELNPGLSPSTLKAGGTIVLPAPRTATANQTGAADTLLLHKVAKGETLYGIAKRYGLTVEELVAANPDVSPDGDKKLKKGHKIVVPKHKEQPAPPPARPEGTDTLRLAFVLPLKADTQEGRYCVEYYRGALLAANKWKEQGKHLTIYAYDETSAADNVNAAGAGLRRNKVDLIVGPLFPSHFTQLAETAAETGAKLLVPFSSKMTMAQPGTDIFLANAPETFRNARCFDLFRRVFPKGRLVIVKTAKADETAFTEGLRAALGSKEYECVNLHEHFNNEDLQRVLSATQPNFIIADASGEKQARDMVTRIKQFINARPSYDIAVLGYAPWQGYNEKLQDDYFQINTYLFTHYYYNENAAATKAFLTDYRRWFSTNPYDVYPRFALLGYDQMQVLLGGMFAHGRDFRTQPVKTETIQGHLQFSPIEQGGCQANRNTMLLHFKKDRTIDKIQAR